MMHNENKSKEQRTFMAVCHMIGETWEQQTTPHAAAPDQKQKAHGLETDGCKAFVCKLTQNPEKNA